MSSTLKLDIVVGNGSILQTLADTGWMWRFDECKSITVADSGGHELGGRAPHLDAPGLQLLEDMERQYASKNVAGNGKSRCKGARDLAQTLLLLKHVCHMARHVCLHAAWATSARQAAAPGIHCPSGLLRVAISAHGHLRCCTKR
jgi:hypothetical protein